MNRLREAAAEVAAIVVEFGFFAIPLKGENWFQIERRTAHYGGVFICIFD